MKGKIKGFIIGAVAAATLTAGVTALAAGKIEIKALLNEDIKIMFHGNEAVLHDENGDRVYPISYNGTTYVPIRGVAQLYGDVVSWDGDTQSAIIGASQAEQDSDEIYKLGAVTPFTFPGYRFAYNVIGEKYWDTVIESVTVESAVQNDAGEYVLKVAMAGHVENVAKFISPRLHVKFVFCDSYGLEIGSAEGTLYGANKDGTALTGTVTLVAPKGAVMLGLDKNSAQ
jgi:hypothetical protein